MNIKELNEEIEKLLEAEDSIQPVYDELTHPEMDLDAVILTALKNCNTDDPDLQKELEDSSLAEVVYPNLKELSVEELKAIMEHHREFTGHHDNSLYPSEVQTFILASILRFVAKSFIKYTDWSF